MMRGTLYPSPLNNGNSLSLEQESPFISRYEMRCLLLDKQTNGYGQRMTAFSKRETDFTPTSYKLIYHAYLALLM
jgi:hypothetical protein